MPGILSWPRLLATCAIVLVSAAGCRQPGPAAVLPAAEPEAYSLLGVALYPPPLPPEVEADLTAKLAAARTAWQAAPRDLEAIVWYGRRTAYLGHYQEAIDIYSRGLEIHPDDPELLRHRGHRLLSVRDFGRAIADLETAARQVAGQPDRVEPDGLPNARNIPTSTLHGNIWYHLGLAYYLEGELEEALRCYRQCLLVSKNPDMLVATSHWLYMTSRRLGLGAEAAALLEPISEDLDVIENHAYHQLLLMYRGQRLPEEILPVGEDSIESATAAYGVANWHAYNGREAEARAVLERIIAGGQWSAFGHLAAEADLARAR